MYLNNAGTTWPKPETVYEAISDFNRASPTEWRKIFWDGHKVTTSFFGIANPDRFLFTQSCSQSLSVAFTDFPWEYGDRLIISTMEHHALSRWFTKLQNERGIVGIIIPRAEDGPIDLDLLEEELKKGARMVAMTMASNVTGEILPYEKIVNLCKKYGTVSLLDGAQTAGIIPIDLSELDPDIFVFAGHKGPFGPQGIGGLYLSKRISLTCPTAACEITPDQTELSSFPTYCDTGSAPMQAIVGMTSGIQWLRKQGWEQLIDHRSALATKLRNGLKEIKDLEIVGAEGYKRYTGAVSIASSSISLEDINEQLIQNHQIQGSFGFQCAPMAHEAVGTAKTGTLRFSVGPMNTSSEVDNLLSALQSILSVGS